MKRSHRMRLAKSLLLAALALSPVGGVLVQEAQAQEAPEPETVGELVKALEATYRNVTSLKADFVQVVKSPVAGEQRQRGKVNIKKPRKARWEFVGDQSSLFITDGKKMWLYTPAAKQVMVMEDLSKANGADLAELLDDLGKLDQRFDLKMLSAGDRSRPYLVEARPKEKGARFQKVELEISRRKFMLERVVITGSMGEVTELSFSGIKLNAAIPDSDFSFVAPPGVQVIPGAGI